MDVAVGGDGAATHDNALGCGQCSRRLHADVEGMLLHVPKPRAAAGRLVDEHSRLAVDGRLAEVVLLAAERDVRG